MIAHGLDAEGKCLGELLLTLLLVLYLLPCAVQDLRTRHVSNWLTIPEFVVAWPLALWLGMLPFTFAVFAGCCIAPPAAAAPAAPCGDAPQLLCDVLLVDAAPV